MDSIIIEIRAGAGGDEATIFASDLYKMYSKYALSQGWEVKKVDNLSMQIKGQGVFDKLKNEGGVHRVQRVPKTEKNNRIHTSTASVAILKKGQEASVEIKSSDLKYDYFCSSGKGGQNVNKRQTAIRITHIPTGEVVTSQTQRNLEQNRQTAMAMLKARLLSQKQSKQSAEVKENRKAQIGTADRSEKIRTYNFPQDRVTDHRIKKSFHNIEKIMDGKIDKIVSALQGQTS